MMNLELGAYVMAGYKTGVYIGKWIEHRGAKSVIEVLAVDKHPEQGNLHHPHETEGIFFHQRRALAHLEKALVPTVDIVIYEKEIPDYRASLLDSLNAEEQRMTTMWVQPELQKWSLRAREELKLLRKEYGFEAD